jgi:hypothetical protein
MTRSMTRWAVAACMALAALSAVTVLDLGSREAEAAPSVSRFAGTYDWDTTPISLPVTISDGGRIAASASSGGGEFSYETDVNLSGRVAADGSYSFTKSVTVYFVDLFGKRNLVSKGNFKYAGKMELDAVGNVVGTASTGDSFVWVRR